MPSIFSKIVKGEIPSYKVAETENCYAFLDINPLAIGHTLVIPKEEIDNFFELNDQIFSELMLLSKRIAKVLGEKFPCEKVGAAVVGLEVPHAHIHLIPINGAYDIDFSKPKLKLTAEEFAVIAQTISSSL